MSEWILAVVAALAGGGVAWTLAQARARARQAEGRAAEAERKAIEALVAPLAEALATYQREARGLEEKRLREISSVGEQMRSVAETQALLHAETSKLASALRSPQVRGRWGEMTLRRIAEVAGLSAHCDFEEQPTVGADGGRQRPDMIVRLPAGRRIVVDAKAPLAGYLDALEARGEREKDEALRRYAGQVRSHVTNLASKEYWEQSPGSPEFVVLFVPNDSFLAEAALKDPGLLEYAVGRRVVIATPASLIALLLAVAYGWRQASISENAEKVSALGQELYGRMATLAEQMAKIGGALGRAVESYNAAVASIESRVFPSARKLGELGAGGAREVEVLQPVDERPRLAPEP